MSLLRRHDSPHADPVMRLDGPWPRAVSPGTPAYWVAAGPPSWKQSPWSAGPAV